MTGRAVVGLLAVGVLLAGCAVRATPTGRSMPPHTSDVTDERPSPSQPRPSPSPSRTSAPTSAHPAVPGRPSPTSSSPSSPATRQHTVRPVTAAGRPAAGYTVHAESEPLDCSFRQPSPVAVDDNVIACVPTAAYAVACWRSAVAGHVLCLQSATATTLHDFPATGPTSVRAPAGPVPLNLRLADGTMCSVRYGGAWSPLAGHPGWTGAYACTGSLAVWAAPGTTGIHTGSATWTVQVASISGRGPLRTSAVTAAYFVGTAR